LGVTNHRKLAAGGVADIFAPAIPIPRPLGRESNGQTKRPARDMDFFERFVGEIRSLSADAHPNWFVRSTWAKKEGRYFAVLEYVHGMNHRSLMNRSRERKAPFLSRSRFT